ncbi:FkbM family methyltransferase [Halobellus rufus]|uniref:FkbM family methyltransferase n=1 Tax=Halobellus rufus TaxID=1448860 RepID=UPI000678673C|nr:FkbM family methyltransferase [Halobellus rufus]
MYKPTLKRAFRRFGGETYARSLYATLYRIWSGGTVSLEIDGASADILVENASEVANVRNVAGKERPVARIILDELNEDDVFWDVGANVGVFACLAGDIVESGAVVAFEPYPPNVERLRKNIRRNGVACAVESRALTDAEGERPFFVMGTEEAGAREGSLRDDYVAAEKAVQTISVEMTTGDRIVSSGTHPAPNVVKIDVEGAAPEVIAGMRATLDRPECRLVVVEPHNNADAIESQLEAVGFHTRRIHVEGSPRIVASADG